MEHTRRLFTIATSLVPFALCAQLSLSWASAHQGVGADAGQCTAFSNSATVFVAGNFTDAIDLRPDVGGGELTANGPGVYIARYSISGFYGMAGSLGSTGTIAVKAMDATTSGFVITGCFSGIADLDPDGDSFPLLSNGATDAFVAAYDHDLHLLWAKAIGGPGTDVGTALAVDDLGNIYLGGTFENGFTLVNDGTTFTINSNGGADGMLGYLGANGSLLWLKAFGGSGDETLTALSPGVGDVAVIGSFTGTMDIDPGTDVHQLTSEGMNDIYFGIFSNYGAMTTGSAYGGIEDDLGVDVAFDAVYGWLLACTFKGSLVLGNGIADMTSAGEADMLVICRNSGGFLYWANQIGSAANDRPIAIEVQDFYHYFLVGEFNADLTTGAAFINQGGSDLVMIAMDNNGDTQQSFSIGGAGDELCHGTSVNGQGQILITGSLTGDVDFDPTGGTTMLYAGSPPDGFIAMYDAANVGIHDTPPYASIPYPNPASDQLRIPIGGMNGIATLTITDLTGRTVSAQQVTLANELLIVDVDGIANGTYSFTLQFATGRSTSFNVVISK